MTAEMALALLLAAPLAHALAVILLSRPPGLLDVVHIGAALGIAGFVLNEASQGARARIVLGHPVPNVDL